MRSFDVDLTVKGIPRSSEKQEWVAETGLDQVI